MMTLATLPGSGLSQLFADTSMVGVGASMSGNGTTATAVLPN
jgi:hypothetical protein